VLRLPEAGGSALEQTRNLLLQIATEGRAASCHLGAGCESGCSGHGLCQSKLFDTRAESSSPSDNYCLCDANFWGADCSAQEFGRHCGGGEVFVPYTLYNINRGKWTD
jgi:hypothetical protein